MTANGNILMVANWESNVGYAWWLMENFWTTIATSFGKQGISSHLIYPKITTLPESISSSDIHVHECDFRDRSLKNIIRIRHIITKNNIRYIYLSDSPAYSYFYILLRFWGVKKIVVHDHTPGERTIATGLIRFIKTVIQKCPLYTADHFIAVTSYVYDRFINVNCIPAKKCAVASNGIHPINLQGANLSYAHHNFAIPENRTVIITTGRASYYKGIDFFIRCADELVNNQNFKNLHFIFCGDGPDIDDFKSLCNDFKLDNHFTFTGKRSDIRKILPSCDIGFHASKGEVGYSLSILEYMSAGLATIVPDSPSTAIATRHDDTGLIYKHRDVMSACDAIKQCLPDQYRKRLSVNAIKEIALCYNISQTNTKLIEILNNIYE